MTITVKNVFCGGALITSDDLKRWGDDQLVCAMATVVSGSAYGRASNIYRSKKSGVVLFGTSESIQIGEHRDGCDGDVYCDCDYCEGHECSCDVRHEQRFRPLPLIDLKAGDEIALSSLFPFVELEDAVAERGLVWQRQDGATQ